MTLTETKTYKKTSTKTNTKTKTHRHRQRQIQSASKSTCIFHKQEVQGFKILYLLSCDDTRGEYFTPKPIFLHYPKRGPAQNSKDAITRDSNISARTPKKVVFLHEPPQKAFFLAQLNKKLAKSACNSLICLIFM